MMKIIHTSDWHLGHSLYDYDRTAEQTSFLLQLADIVEREQPDALIVSGDIYHYAIPSSSAQKMYTEGMLRIADRCQNMTIVVTAGNHDSAARLEINRTLWKRNRVNVIGSIEKKDNKINIDKHIISVETNGKTKGYIIAVPHVYPQNFPSPEDKKNTENIDKQKIFFQMLLDEVKSRNKENLPVVMMAHLAVSGSNASDQEYIGQMEYVNLEDLGTGYDYLALGHIHHPQGVPAHNKHARYSGSPLPVSFDETYSHSVIVADIESGKEPQIKFEEIHNPMPLITMPRNAVDFKEAIKILNEFDKSQYAYIQLRVLEDELPPDAMERATAACEGTNCRFCHLKIERKPKKISENISLNMDDIQTLNPLEIAKICYKERKGVEMSDKLCTLMQEAINSIKDE